MTGVQTCALPIFDERIVPGHDLHGANSLAGAGRRDDCGGTDMLGGDSTLFIHRCIEVVRTAPRHTPVRRESRLLPDVEFQGLSVELRHLFRGAARYARGRQRHECYEEYESFHKNEILTKQHNNYRINAS